MPTLGVKELLEEVFPALVGRSFFESMTDLLNLLPQKRQGGAFHRIPRPCPSRWMSLGDFTEYVVLHQTPIRAFLRDKYSNQQDRPPVVNLLFEVPFEQPAPCFRFPSSFVRQTEGAQASLADAWSAPLGVFPRLFQLGQQGNEYAVHCSHAFHKRLTKTAELYQLILGCLVTRKGLAWYPSLGPGMLRGCPLADADVIDSVIRSVLKHFRLF
jgi:hypothetical protein